MDLATLGLERVAEKYYQGSEGNQSSELLYIICANDFQLENIAFSRAHTPFQPHMNPTATDCLGDPCTDTERFVGVAAAIMVPLESQLTLRGRRR